MTYIELVNLFKTVNMLKARSRVLALWCCLIPCLIGVFTVTIFMLMELGIYFNCRHLVWTILTGISISNVCHSMVLMQKAYLILGRAKWIVYTSIVPMLSQLSYVFVMVHTSYITLAPDIGCSIHYPYFTIWLWFANSFPLNMIFSAIFCYIAIKQYRQYGSSAWRRLARDGIQTMCMAALCNTMCCILLIVQPAGPNSDLLLAMDW
ncbi:hypothetical protein SYNPS1DRAFT_22545 [Syncephalis pseudoplumigaleata]|uniref:Uncharacterized protein n=1 Tax=Syncephalis pseudoplumigaleata TaxID=1712513 RepID=A0A4P9YZA4_9FUNG|nr:hypothetical protein SYNPS1DRAFT_22545 [Syncephalis pseudoplumigaleata]|eukprot:RKP25503.1 hypothetical protein SYNPS1DRAFT_22545 [Syncephalis pseudoplumigaleata]